MEKPSIEVLDPIRMFWGELPWNFAFEIALRSGFMFVFLLIVLRISGKRSLSQMSPFEFSLLIALGSAVGDPMFYEDVPLLHACIVIVVVVFLLKFLGLITENSKLLERVLEGKPICLIDKGRIIKKNTSNEKISSNEVFMKLREAGVRNLAEVENSYLEVSGNVSVFCYEKKEKRIGLNILPFKDKQEWPVGSLVNGYYSCNECGYTQDYKNKMLENCNSCNHYIWVESEETNAQDSSESKEV